MWVFKVDLGKDPVTGKRRRRTITFAAKGARAAQAHANWLVTELGADQPVTTRATVEDLFAEFLTFSESRGRAPTTLHEYRRAISTFFLPAIGSVRLSELTVRHLDQLYTAALSADPPLSASSVRKYNAILKAALNQAIRWEWLETNPAMKVTLPSLPATQFEAPTPEDVRRIIRACQEADEQLGVFVLLAAVTGCRRGEIAALRFCDVEDQGLAVRASVYSAGSERGIKGTKSGRERWVMLDPQVRIILERWMELRRSHAADFDVTVGEESFLFSNRPDGSFPINIDTVSAKFRRVADELGLRHIHLHSLRHFAATELLAAGVNARDAADRLGHADPALTLRVYAHATDERQRHAATVGARVLEGLDAPPPAS
jgi:integrase